MSQTSRLGQVPLLADRVQHTVDESDGFLRAERPRKLEGFIDDHSGRRTWFAEKLADRQTENQPVDDGHTLGAPTLGRVGNQCVNRLEPLDGVPRELRGKLSERWR